MKRIGIFSLALLLLLGCTTSLMNLKLDMTKAEVISNIGKPTAARGSLKNKHGEVIEIWEYTRWKGPETADYWLYFFDDKLVQWGEAGDWGREADRIYELRFRPIVKAPE